MLPANRHASLIGWYWALNNMIWQRRWPLFEGKVPKNFFVSPFFFFTWYMKKKTWKDLIMSTIFLPLDYLLSHTQEMFLFFLHVSFNLRKKAYIYLFLKKKGFGFIYFLFFDSYFLFKPRTQIAPRYFSWALLCRGKYVRGENPTTTDGRWVTAARNIGKVTTK